MRNSGSKVKLASEALRVMEEDLKQNGYAIARGVVSSERLTELNLQLNEAYRSSAKFQGGGSILGHLNCFPGEAGRFVLDDLNDSGLIDALLAMRSGRRNDMFARVNWNLPGSGAQHWHMDGTFIDDFLLCNVAIIDIDKTNGPTEVIPGSHSQFCPFWRFALERKAQHSVPVVLNQGDVLVRTSTLWHRGTPNRSGTARPMMSVSFGEKEATEADPFQVNDGRITFYPNWYSNSRRVHIVRERVERTLPITRSAGRFVKSLLRPRGYDVY
jgi:hypothetical protein